MHIEFEVFIFKLKFEFKLDAFNIANLGIYKDNDVLPGVKLELFVLFNFEIVILVFNLIKLGSSNASFSNIIRIDKTTLSLIGIIFTRLVYYFIALV